MSSTITKDSPAIYVASLSDYNAGTIHGCWIHIDEDTTVEEVETRIQAMLAKSREPIAEEWEIHDTDNWPRGSASTVAGWGLEEVVLGGNLLAEHGEAIMFHHRRHGDWDLDVFADTYVGCFASENSFVEAELEIIWDMTIPTEIAPHVNWDSLTEDVMENRFASFKGEDGIHIFTIED